MSCHLDITNCTISINNRIKQLLLYKKNIRPNSTNAKILQMLYRDKSLTTRQISDAIGNKPYSYTKKMILQLLSNKYIQCNKSHYNRQYNLTQMGRWFVICENLDHVSFQSLCVLAAVFYAARNNPNGPSRSYFMTSFFRKLFDESFEQNKSAVYSRQNITLSIKMLIDRNLVYRMHQDIIRINPHYYEMLQEKYDEDLTTLAKWNYDISEICKQEFLKHHVISDKQKNMLKLLYPKTN